MTINNVKIGSKRLKEIILIISRAIIVILSIIIMFLYWGINVVTIFVYKQFLFTAANVASFIITIVLFAGHYISRCKQKQISKIVNLGFTSVSVISYAYTILSWFEINLFRLIWNIIWIYILKPLLICIAIILGGIVGLYLITCVIGMIVIGIIAIIDKIAEKNYKKEKKITNIPVTSLSQNTISYKSSLLNPHILNKNLSGGTPISMIGNNLNKYNTAEGSYNNFYSKSYHLTCPLCGGNLIVKKRHSDGKRFYGCSNYNGGNGCRYTRSI